MPGLKSWASAVFGVLVAALPAAAAPRVLALFPTGAQRGTTVTLTLSGEALKDLKGVYCETKGLSIAVKPGGDASTRTATVTVAPEVPSGIYEVRFWDDSGLSNVRYFQVGTLPELSEVEPNDEKGQPITLPVTINGRIKENPDRDGFTFTAKAGQSIVCQIDGIRVLGQVGDSWLKGYLEVCDANGKTLASSEGKSDNYYRWDPTIVFTPMQDGLYTVYFRDLNWRGDLRSVYRLSVGALPHATALFPPGGQRGTTVAVTASGPHLTTTSQPIAVAADAPDIAPLTVGGALNTRPFQASPWPDVLQKSGCNTLADAQTVPWPCVVNGHFTPGKLDYYKLKVEQKVYVALEIFSRRLGTAADPELLLYDSKGNLIQADDDSRSQDAWLVRVLDPGEYTIAARETIDRGGDEFPYRLHLAPAVVKLGATVTPDTGKLVRGQSLTLNIHVEREHWDDEIRVTLEPTRGLSAAPLVLPKSKADGQLTVTVAADAPLGPVRLQLVATAKPGNVPLRALARGQETYNLQGTAFQRDTLGPVLLITEK